MLRVLSSQPEAQLVAVFDASSDRAQQVATRYGTQVAPSPEALLAEVDAVSIASPTPLHFAHVEQSLSVGKHVLVEKAITEQVDQAEVLTALARRTGKLLMVGHIERYNPVFSELKRLIVGRGQQCPFAIVFRRLSSFSTSSQAVDVVLDLMIHDVDLMLDLCRGLSVSASRWSWAESSELARSITASPTSALHGGPVVTLTASRVTEQKVRSIEVTTPSAFIVADLLRKEIQSYRNTVSSYQAQDGGVSYQQHTQIDQVQVPTDRAAAVGGSRLHSRHSRRPAAAGDRRGCDRSAAAHPVASTADVCRPDSAELALSPPSITLQAASQAHRAAALRSAFESPKSRARDRL
jgi:predicted dehydrogenase